LFCLRGNRESDSRVFLNRAQLFGAGGVFLYEMNSLLRQRRLWIAILLGLLMVNLAVHWPWAGRKSDMARSHGVPPGMPGGQPSEEMRTRMESALAKLPEAQRTEIQARMEADKVFFDSLKNLSEAERRQKMQEHFAQNPPPQIPGMERMGPPPGAGGGPGAPGSSGESKDPVSSSGPGNDGAKDRAPDGSATSRLPEPSIRRGMDQQIANSQKAPATQQ
jgi:hypothetical protein